MSYENCGLCCAENTLPLSAIINLLINFTIILSTFMKQQLIQLLGSILDKFRAEFFSNKKLINTFI